MDFTSSRGKSPALPFSKAVLQGLAPDGGLYCPSEVPKLSEASLHQLLEMDFISRATKIFSLFADDSLQSSLSQIPACAYSKQNFGVVKPAQITRFNDDTHILELFHGPTAAFKDFALQFLPRVMDAAIATHNSKERCVLVATSGDTGGAAMAGFANIKNSGCIVFYPSDGVSPLQKAQMQSITGPRVTAFAIDGDFDAAQAAVKAMFADRRLIDQLAKYDFELSSANSINIGRLIAQIFYVFDGYAELVANKSISFGDTIDICVPTGNFGNILAAFYAKQMGLPLGQLICATNNNDSAAQLLQTSVLDVRGRKTEQTISPAMDILRASNLERMLYEASGENAAKIVEWQQSLINEGMFELDEKTFDFVKNNFRGVTVTDESTIEQMRHSLKTYNYLPDPHTAVALAGLNTVESNNPVLVFSTAHYAKFGQTAFAAVFQDSNILTDESEVLKKIEETVKNPPIPNALHNVFTKAMVNTTEISSDLESMKQAVLQAVTKWKQ
jgi:threonine synthase